MSTEQTPQELKSCCATAYGSDVVALLLGESYHPGGLGLTRHLARLLALNSGERVLDVAAGRGTTALLLAQEQDAQVHGIDLSAANVALAQGAAAARQLDDRVTFTLGDAEQLPFPAATFDAVICECALCTFPDKPAATAELARVLKPGGRLGITDVVADTTRLPEELTSLAAWIACVADARPLDEYSTMLTEAGLTITTTQRHDRAMTRMIDQIEGRLSLVSITARDKAEALGVDFDRARPILNAAREAVAAGILGYALLIAEKRAAPNSDGA
jgi:arsenite methyltransferase